MEEKLYGYICVEEPGVFGVFDVRESPSWRLELERHLVTASPLNGGYEKLFTSLDVVKQRYTLHSNLDDAYNELRVMRAATHSGPA